MTQSDTVNVLEGSSTPVWPRANIASSLQEYTTHSSVANASTLSFGVSNAGSGNPISRVQLTISGIDISGLTFQPSFNPDVQPTTASPYAVSISGQILSYVALSSGRITDIEILALGSSALTYTFELRDVGVNNSSFEGDFLFHISPGELTKATKPGEFVTIRISGFKAGSSPNNYENFIVYGYPIPAWPSSVTPDLTRFASAGSVTNTADLEYVVGNRGTYSVSKIVYHFTGFDASALTSVSATTGGISPTSASPYRASVSGGFEIDFWLDSGTLHTFSARVGTQLDRIHLDFFVSGAAPGEWQGEATLKIPAGEFTSLPTGAVQTYIFGYHQSQNQRQIFENLIVSRTFLQGQQNQNNQQQNNQQQNNQQQNNSQPGTDNSGTSPAAYSGPQLEIAGSVKADRGSKVSITGKKLSEISEISIDGIALVFELNAQGEIEFSIPASVSPGVHDLVIRSSSFGTLTHMNAITVTAADPVASERLNQEGLVRVSVSLTNRSLSELSQTRVLEQVEFAKVQSPSLNKVRCIVNAKDEELAARQATELCEAVKQANPDIEIVVVEPRATVKHSMVYARVIFGWN